MQKEQKCFVCNNNMKTYRRIAGMLLCPKCGLVVADTSLSDDDVKRLYSEKYFMGEEYTDYVADRRLHISNFERKIKRIRKIIPNLNNMNVLEIGCAYGFFLKTIDKYCNYTKGIDVSADAVKYAREYEQVDAVEGDLLHCDELKEDGTIDLVCMWDVIEHLTMPREYLEKIYNLLSPGGYVCITTGDMGSLNARLRGRKWRQIHPPTHLSYFSRKTLQKMLIEMGYEICDISYLWNRLSVRNIIYSILCLRFDRIKWYDKHKNKWYMDLSVYANFHDYMFFIVKKPA